MNKIILSTLLCVFSFGQTFADTCCNQNSCCEEPNLSRNALLSFDLLLWRLKSCNWDWGFEFDLEKDTFTSLKKFDRDTGVGFRVGYFKSCDYLDFGVRYTYYDFEEKKKFHSDNLDVKNILTTTFSGNAAVTSQSFGNAKAKYYCDLDQLDAEMGYTWNPCNCCNDFRLFGGVSFATIDQELKSAFTGSEFGLSDTKVNTLDVKQTNTFDAYGLYLGMESDYSLYSCLGLYAKGLYGIYYAEFDRKKTILSENEIESIGILNRSSKFKKKNHRYPSHFEFAAGLTIPGIDCLCACWEFRLGYEYQYWTNLKRFINPLERTFDEFIPVNPPNDSGQYNIKLRRNSITFDGFVARVSASF